MSKDDQIKEALARAIEQWESLNRGFIVGFHLKEAFRAGWSARGQYEAEVPIDQEQVRLEAENIAKTVNGKKTWGYTDTRVKEMIVEGVLLYTASHPTATQPVAISGKWIPSGERLPTHNYSVLGYVVKGGLAGEHGPHPMIDIVSCIPATGWVQFVGDKGDESVKVSHWMDLPSTPAAPAAEQAELDKPSTFGQPTGETRDGDDGGSVSSSSVASVFSPASPPIESEKTK